jgi:hypothetical protein
VPPIFETFKIGILYNHKKLQTQLRENALAILQMSTVATNPHTFASAISARRLGSH